MMGKRVGDRTCREARAGAGAGVGGERRVTMWQGDVS